VRDRLNSEGTSLCQAPIFVDDWEVLKLAIAVQVLVSDAAALSSASAESMAYDEDESAIPEVVAASVVEELLWPQAELEMGRSVARTPVSHVLPEAKLIARPELLLRRSA